VDHHGVAHLQDRSIHPLSDAILLRSGRCRPLSEDTIVHEVLLESVAGVLASVVSAKCANAAKPGCLQVAEVIEAPERVGLAGNQVGEDVASAVIDQRHEVSDTSE
jgi:hypothetical protein